MTGVVGTLHGQDASPDAPGRCIAFRAEFDGLPMQEKAKVDYASQDTSRFHGCGHDGHMVTALTAVAYLAEHRQFDGTVRFIFQPAEELLTDARAMIADGLFDRFWAKVTSDDLRIMFTSMLVASSKLRHELAPVFLRRAIERQLVGLRRRYRSGQCNRGAKAVVVSLFISFPAIEFIFSGLPGFLFARCYADFRMSSIIVMVLRFSSTSLRSSASSFSSTSLAAFLGENQWRFRCLRSFQRRSSFSTTIG